VKIDRPIFVRCLRCRHEGILSGQTLADAGLKPDAPISSFVKRLRCAKCGSGSVMATRQPGRTAPDLSRRKA
jgi:hypothetical protein